MVSVLTSSAVDRVFEPRLGQTKDFEIDICCFSSRSTQASLRSKNRDQLARNQDKVVKKLSNMSTHVVSVMCFV